MAAEVPGWCERCGAVLEHDGRLQGRARSYCGDACRQAASRERRLRRGLIVQVGLEPAQVDRLLTAYRVVPRSRT